MKLGLGERIRRRVSRVFRTRDPRAGLGRRRLRRERSVIEEISADFSSEELQEFLEGDRAPVQADPAFKAKLREELWDYLEKQRRETEH